MGASLAPQLAEALARLPQYLGGHVLVSVTAILLGLATSLPLALLSLQRPALRRLLLGAASVVQTIPGLALLALFYPLLLGLAALCERLFGATFSALGFLPSVLALALYSMLPVLRNTLTGLLGIDPALKEAAAGVGMTERQSLFMVELPLALPVIMAGIRTAAVWVIGTATLSTPIGQTSLGNYIFTGLQTQNWVFVLFGCVAAAVFALAVDQLLTLMESGMASRRRWRVAVGALGLVLLTLGALIPSLARPRADYVTAAKPFAEQYVLAALIEGRLRTSGLTAAQRDGLGSSVIFEALAASEIDVYVDYSGTIWANQMHRSDVLPRAEVLAETARWLRERHGITLLGDLGFENAYALAMPRRRAEALGIRSLADLAGVAPQLSIAGDYEFFGRPEWRRVREVYGLSFREQRQMQAGVHVPRRRERRCRRDRRLHQRRTRRQERPCRLERSEACHPALRCGAAAVAPQSQRPGAGGRAAAPGRRDQRGGDARGQPARGRRCLADRSGALAVERDRGSAPGAEAPPPQALPYTADGFRALPLWRWIAASPCRRACTEKRWSRSVQVLSGDQPAPRASAPNEFDRILVAVLGVNGFAGAEVDAFAGNAHALALEARQMHFDARALAVEEGVMLEAREVELGAELAIDAREQIEIELRGDALRVVVGLLQDLRVLHQIDADDEDRAVAEDAAGVAQERRRLVRLEVADGRAREETGARQRLDRRPADRTAG